MAPALRSEERVGVLRGGCSRERRYCQSSLFLIHSEAAFTSRNMHLCNATYRGTPTAAL